MAKAGRASGAAAASTSAATRQALVDAAIESLRLDGYAGASARAIAARAQSNQSLVFYHYGSVAELLLAALDEVSDRRMQRYTAAVAGFDDDPARLVAAATEIFREDLDEGYVTVLVEMIAGTAPVPQLAEQVALRIAPWRAFARTVIESAIASTPLASLVPVDDAAYAVVALYLGMEMLSHLDGDRGPALSLFDQAARLAAIFAGTAAPTSNPEETR